MPAVDPLLRRPAVVPGDPLELPEEAPRAEQTRGVLQEPLPDLPGVRRKPAEAGAVRLPQFHQLSDRPGEPVEPDPQQGQQNLCKAKGMEPPELSALT